MKQLIIFIALVSFSLVANAQNAPVLIKITADNINVRKEPSVNAPISLCCGEVWKQSKDFAWYQKPINGWYPVFFYPGCEECEGYISGKFVEVIYASPFPWQSFGEKEITTTSGLTLKISRLNDNECLINTIRKNTSGEITYRNYLGTADNYQISLSYDDGYNSLGVGKKFPWKKGEEGFDEGIAAIRENEMYEPPVTECLFWDSNKQKFFFSGNYYDLVETNLF